MQIKNSKARKAGLIAGQKRREIAIMKLRNNGHTVQNSRKLCLMMDRQYNMTYTITFDANK